MCIHGQYAALLFGCQGSSGSRPASSVRAPSLRFALGGCRFPVVLAGTDTEIRTGEEVSVEGEAPPLLKFTIVSQPGLPRRQIYYPYISFRLSRPLQVSTGPCDV